MKLRFNLNFGGEQVRTIDDVRTQAINAREILSEIIKTFQENEETDSAYVEVDFSMFNYSLVQIFDLPYGRVKYLSSPLSST